MADQPMIEIEAVIVRETEKAYLIDDGTKSAWVPKSQVDAHFEGMVGNSGYRKMTFVMPEWLAMEKNFI